MEVILANHSGFCFGVEKAVRRTTEEVNSIEAGVHPVCSLGPVIHNQQVVESLEKKGLNTINDVSEASEGTVIIRSHGVAKDVYDVLEAKGLRVVDTTCPFVKKIQTIVQARHQLGETVIIVGNSEHPEVIGINGWCQNRGIIISDENDLKKVPAEGPLCVVAQTTLPVQLFEKIASKLTELNPQTYVHHTICLATQDRQRAAAELAVLVSAMVVVGGRHSSNTRKLYEVCQNFLPESTYLVETQTDLPIGKLIDAEKIGLTAGASTPGDEIQSIYDTLCGLKKDQIYQIAIDGPAGAGKSTIAKLLASKLAFTYIDTGAMYRAITYKILKQCIPLNDVHAMIALAKQTEITIENEHIFLDQEDVTDLIRSEKVTKGVSTVASVKEIREEMVQFQKCISQHSHVVMDGRDIGTVVLTEADLKVFLTASVEERARRRFEELREQQPDVQLKAIEEQIKQRDYVDENREHDPLTPANDAVHIDSTSLSIHEVVENITQLFCEKIKKESVEKLVDGR
ncbi:4-hydroxy-3-methylbut-2-enyl diphosphate reductase [Anoxynatronum buryatiense]|uniref:Multifunctional fusion protein n=1 Tax=Anoxynatronum buryatiense TaxID=489973 RepID=A0AA46AIC8_9CLOT|nr:4-hydroxy-3-methylbut-2-enyl diphosphate reductase [Anoxynatronum buryatiense]SMP47966.1 4-hydroxy-3-methylbut-2-enyl diphosphate reductase [Anoxynatronum buryatiense]